MKSATRLLALATWALAASAFAKDAPDLVACQTAPCVDDAGKLQGDLLVHWPDGKKWKQGKLASGKPEGEWTWFWPNGKPMARVTYKKGKRNGAAEYYYQNGNIQARGRYENDQRPEVFKFFSYKGGATNTFPLHQDGRQKAKMKGEARRVRDVAEGLRTLAAQPMPPGLSADDKVAFDEHTQWLTGAAERVEVAGVMGQCASGSPVTDTDHLPKNAASDIAKKYLADCGSGRPLVSELSAMNMQYMRLQSKLRNEARSYDELAKASLARHRAARRALDSIL